ncbi:hypothetical protein V1291_002607 [Nitrobacteraceae bacterium AZCC 1564]
MLDVIRPTKTRSAVVRHLLSFAMMTVLVAIGADAQELNCADFQRIPNGLWIPIRQLLITAPAGNVLIGPGNAFDPGIPFKGIDFATLLNAKCE